MSGASLAGGPTHDGEAQTLLLALDELDLARSTIVGSYVRFDEPTRNALKEFRQRTVAAFESQSRAPTNFLLWGPPGSGKSYLVQQVAASLGASVRYVELNLAQLAEADFRAALDALAAEPRDVLCLIDEIDAKPEAAWPYEALLPHLEPPSPRAHRTSFCLAGSGGLDRKEFRERIAGRPKGTDLLSRIPRGNEFTVQRLGPGDKILVSAAQLLASAKEEGREVREIEKLALYFIAVNPDLASARQLRGLASQTAQRIPKGEDRLRYDYLFAAGDPENKQFWTKVEPLRDRLANAFVPVRGVGGTEALSATAGRGPGNGSNAGPADPRRLAILPFLNISPDPADAYFADGLTEELIATVSRIGRLRVIARTSVMRFRDHPKSAIETARELNVGSLLEGSVRKAGSDLRVTAQLVDVSTDEPLWSTTFDRRLENVFAIQQELAQRIAESLQVKLLAGEKARLRRRPTENFEAYELYLRGRHSFLGSESDLRLALQHYRKAAELDPTFALAYCGIAEAEALLGNRGHTPLPPALERAEAAVRTALRLDPELSEAHVALAPVLYNRYNWEGALAELDRALELDSSNMLANFWRAVALGTLGRPAEGIENARKAIELDPLILRRRIGLAQQYYWMREYDRAIEVFSEVPNFGTADGFWILAYAHILSGRGQKGIPLLEALSTDRRLAGPWPSAQLAGGYARVGRTEEAREILRGLLDRAATETIPAGVFAWIYVGLGEFDAAVEWFRKAHAEGSAVAVEDLNVDPYYDEFRRDPRFPELLRLFRFPVPPS
jgi:TolB-like protein/Flp pilus assembly protein TadD